MKYKLEGVCAKSVKFELRRGRLKNVRFFRGCPGNLKALSALLEGMRTGEAVSKFKGIRCGKKKTSCPDQFAGIIEKLGKTA